MVSLERLKIIKRNESENNREYVYRLLRYNILYLNMLPGETLKENEIAQLLNVSRTPVHEAVLMLKDSYLVDVLPQSSSKISLVDLKLMREGHYLRNLIEPAIVRQVAGNITPDMLKLLKQNLDRQDFSGLDVAECFELDEEFHSLIYTAANKPHIWTMVKNVCSDFDRVRFMDSSLIEDGREQAYEEHKAILQILMLGVSPQDDLENFYDRHIGSYKKRFHQLITSYSNYFCDM